MDEHPRFLCENVWDFLSGGKWTPKGSTHWNSNATNRSVSILVLPYFKVRPAGRHHNITGYNRLMFTYRAGGLLIRLISACNT